MESPCETHHVSKVHLMAAFIVPPPQSVPSQDLIAQFTDDDAAKIQVAVAGNVQLWLIWSAMLAQRDPMVASNARFQAGWAALVQMLAQPRMSTIATALGLTIEGVNP
jgi:hypothetical protein